ncbi:hypothetical protein E2C01_001613 [Portunus trituberculatus]|uniref:Uncharacterized protein n=1 Tax=Portunus trituberculatus TaxID=210409 RepID=A0A5B7CH39_PORTR|nr:hypothetical protein [Portunus trituberculatus]
MDVQPEVVRNAVLRTKSTNTAYTARDDVGSWLGPREGKRSTLNLNDSTRHDKYNYDDEEGVEMIMGVEGVTGWKIEEKRNEKEKGEEKRKSIKSYAAVIRLLLSSQ